MFWLLILLLFNADGTKNVQVKIEPTQQGCIQDIQKIAADLKTDHPPELVGAGFKCDGPFNDPAITKLNP